MDYKSKMISKDDIDVNQNYKNALDKIRAANQLFYDQFVNVLNNRPDFSIDENVLYYMADVGSNLLNQTFWFISDEENRINLQQNLYASLFMYYLTNGFYSKDWIAWIITYFTEDNSSYQHLDLDDFNVIMTSVITNGYPLSAVRKKFSDDFDKEHLYEFFTEPYVEPSDSDKASDISLNDFHHDKSPDSFHDNSSDTAVSEVGKEENNELSSCSSDDVTIRNGQNDFLSLLNTLFSDTKEFVEVEDLDPVDNLCTRFNRIAGTLQQSVTDLSGCVTDIFREWEKDRAQIEKFSNIFKVVQKVDLAYKDNLKKKDDYISELEAKIKKLEAELDDDKKIQGLLGELARYHHPENTKS